MSVKVLRLVFWVSATLSAGSAWGREPGQSHQVQDQSLDRNDEEQDVRGFTSNFKAVMLPRLLLEGRTARDAIDTVGKQGFHCTLAPEQKNIIYPSKPYSAFVQCTLLWQKKERIDGLVLMGISLKDWHGDGASLESRYEQLEAAQVTGTSVTRVVYRDNRDTPVSKDASRALNQIMPIPQAHVSVARFVKNAMTHDIACRVTGVHVQSLECIAFKATPACLLASFQSEVSEDNNKSKPLSLWSEDWHVEGRHAPWMCLNSRAQ